VVFPAAEDESQSTDLNWTLTLTGPDSPVVKGAEVTYEATLDCTLSDGSTGTVTSLNVTGLSDQESTTSSDGHLRTCTGTASTLSESSTTEAVVAVSQARISWTDDQGVEHTEDLSAELRLHVLGLQSAAGRVSGQTYSQTVVAGKDHSFDFKITETQPPGFELTEGIWKYRIVCLVVDDGGNTIEQQYAPAADGREFQQLGFTTQGSYIIRFFGDANDNGVWDDGVEAKAEVTVEAFVVSVVDGKVDTQPDSSFASVFSFFGTKNTDYRVQTDPPDPWLFTLLKII